MFANRWQKCFTSEPVILADLELIWEVLERFFSGFRPILRLTQTLAETQDTTNRFVDFGGRGGVSQAEAN